jgi:glycine/D-amino acid oxidase-like deaminating enzyme
VSDGIFAAGFKTRPYWWEAAAPSADGLDPLPDAVDVAIVGGGYCGLSAGLELARGGTQVAVLDREAPGFGASSRNGGMVGGALKIPSDELARAVGPEQARALIEEGDRGFDFIETLIAREKIACHYRRSGRFTGAHSPGHYDALARRIEGSEAAKAGLVAMVPRARQREEIGSDFYYGGMRGERGGGLHPALYHQGLAQAARRAGAKICAPAEVTGITRHSGMFHVEHSGGKIVAREVMIATNGYTTAAFPWHRRRVIPVASYIIATEELAPELARGLSPKGRMLADTKRVLFYFRLSPDGKRLLFGGRAGFKTIDETTAAKRLHRYMRGVYPQLEGVTLTHSWRGNVAFTFDILPHMGRHQGMHYAMGCNGSGVAMATYLGYQTALKIAGRANRACAFDERPFPTSVFYRGTPWFLPLVGGYYRARDAVERAFAR